MRTLFEEGASFDVASMPEFKIVYENIKSMPLDRVQIANKPLPYERLDQLTIDILLGVR